MKRQKAREKGNIAKSQDLSAAFGLGGALVGMMLLGPYTIMWLRDATAHFIGQSYRLGPGHTPVLTLGIDVAQWLAMAALPFMLLMMVIGVAMSLAQVGFIFTTQPLTPDLNRLNPITGFQRFLSLRALVEFVKSLAKLSVVGLVVWMFLRDKRENFIALIMVPPGDLPAAVGALVYGVWWRIVLAMGVIGILDYGFQYWQREQDLRMTAEEAKQESKELEGDPQVKRRIRQLQRQMAQQRMMKEVPLADVIITNPTTYAVALRYDMTTMSAPTVTAKGMRVLAERIRNLAIEHGVPIVQRPELARTLYRTLEPGQAIPEDVYRAVAEVLAFVYQVDRREKKLAV